jgi:hypothetical protein
VIADRRYTGCLGCIFHFKLGSFTVMKEVYGENVYACLKLKTQLRGHVLNTS